MRTFRIGTACLRRLGSRASTTNSNRQRQQSRSTVRRNAAQRQGTVAPHRRSGSDSVIASRTAMGPWAIGAGARNECKVPHGA
jgi:hypothetical protein